MEPPTLVDSFDRPELWSAAAGTDDWSVAEGVLRLVQRPDPEGNVAVGRDLAPELTGLVRIVVRYRAEGDPPPPAALAVRTTVGEQRTVQLCPLPSGDGSPAEAWTEAHCAADLPADRAAAGLTVTMGEPGTLLVDEIRLVPVQVAAAQAIPGAERLPSALDTLVPGPGLDRLGDALDEVRPALVRSKLFARPTLGLAVAEGVALLVGGAGGHRWWTPAVGAVQLGGETVAGLTAPLGAARGYRVDVASTHGAWLGPVGLHLGPVLRVDREQWGSEVLDDGILLGGAADLAVDVGPVAISAGALRLWPVRGAREAEWTWRAGVQLAIAKSDLGLDGAWRATAIGPIADVVLSIGWRFP